MNDPAQAGGQHRFQIILAQAMIACVRWFQRGSVRLS